MIGRAKEVFDGTSVVARNVRVHAIGAGSAGELAAEVTAWLRAAGEIVLVFPIEYLPGSGGSSPDPGESPGESPEPGGSGGSGGSGWVAFIAFTK